MNTGLTQVLTDGETTYLYGLARLSQESDGDAEYYLGDALGSVRQLTEGNGELTYAATYTPYGEVLSSAGEGESVYGYTGEAVDVTGLVYLRARYYNPAAGRFQSRDTWGGDTNSPMSYNLWLYVYGNPINFTDPSGYCPTPLDESDPCWQLLLQIETRYDFVDLQTDLSKDNYWTYDELLSIQGDLERFNLAANIGLNTLYPDDVRLKRVRVDKPAAGGGNYYVCASTYFYFTEGRPIKIYNTWGMGCLIHELAHYLDRANLGLAKPFEKYVGASTFLWWYDPGTESPPIYGGGNPPNRYEDYAESLTEYVLLYTNYSGEDIGIIPGEKRWYFIEAVLDTGEVPNTDESSGCIPGLGIPVRLASYVGGRP